LNQLHFREFTLSGVDEYERITWFTSCTSCT